MRGNDALVHIFTAYLKSKDICVMVSLPNLKNRLDDER